MSVPYSVIIARLGRTTVAAGPYRSAEFAALIARQVGQALPDSPAIDVAPHDEDLLHLPGDARGVLRLLAADDGLPAEPATLRLLAAAHSRLADLLFAAA